MFVGPVVIWLGFDQTQIHLDSLMSSYEPGRAKSNAFIDQSDSNINLSFRNWLTFSSKEDIFDGTSIAEVGNIGKDNFRSIDTIFFSSYNIPGETVIDSTCSKLHCIHIALAFLSEH